MQKHPLISVKQAAEMLRLEERSVRERLINGQLKGEKKTIGLREKWFVYRGAVEDALSKDQSHVITQESPAKLEQVEVSLNTAVQAAPNPEVQELKARLQELEDALKKSPVENRIDADITAETVEEVANESIFDNEGEVPNSGATPRSWHNEDLDSQVMATAEKILKPLMDRVEELTKAMVLKDLEIEEKDKQLKLLPDFEKQKADLLKRVEAERKAAEIQFTKVKEKEEESKALEAEIALLKQKADEAILSAAKLAELEKVVQELQKPKPSWFQRWFLPRSE